MIIIIKQMNEWINIFSYLFITLKYHQYNYKIISLQHKNNGTLLNKYIRIISSSWNHCNSNEQCYNILEKFY
jgi:hypothetical protein